MQRTAVIATEKSKKVNKTTFAFVQFYNLAEEETYIFAITKNNYEDMWNYVQDNIIQTPHSFIILCSLVMFLRN